MKQVSISYAQTVERKKDGSYRITGRDGSETIETGIIDSIYHDGRNRTTFTVTLTKED